MNPNQTTRTPRRGPSACACDRNGRRQPGGRENCLCTEQPIALATAYVKDQPFGPIYSAVEARCRGTLFPDLDMPYGAGGRRR